MKIDITKILGYILLSPAVVSVVLFFITLISGKLTLRAFMVSSSWTGKIVGNITGGGITSIASPLPLYFGLMAIAGAYLIKDNSRV
ncbi:MAG: hypothetical protein Q8Q51_11525 [Lutibacter sp.]|nr:hypothetical protein [Lutibacter sp.]